MEQIQLLRNAKDIKGTRVLLRIDVNVPIKDGRAVDDFRIRKIIPTLEYLRAEEALIVAISHHGDKGQSLRPVADLLGTLANVRFDPECFQGGILPAHENGEIILCENTRFFSGEENNDEEFAKRLALYGDIYVNEAFASSHRAHASIVGIPKFLPSYAGILFEEEVNNLSMAFDPPHPFLFILGGAKASTKLPLVEKYIDSADTIFLGGAIANNFFKAKGYEIGLSVCDELSVDLSKLLTSGKIVLPKDVRVVGNAGITIKKPDEVVVNEKILDAGPETLLDLARRVADCQFVLWNGPLGEYLTKPFDEGTIELIKILADAKAHTAIGGGDTTALISELGMESRFNFLSTGGGAMLEFLQNRTLPGIEALRHQFAKTK